MNSKQTIKIWARVLLEVCRTSGVTEQKKAILRLKEILKAKNREYLLPEILENTFEAITKKSKLEITFAHNQTSDTVEKLKKKLSAKFDGWENIDVKTDSGIIGGFIAKTDQYILNASIKNYLERLRRAYES